MDQCHGGVASGSADRSVKLWDLRTQHLLQHYDAHEEGVTDLSFHPSGSYLLTASADSKLKVWDLVEGRLFYTLHGHEGAVNACSFSPTGDFFASAGADMQAMVWRTNFDQFSLRPNTAASLATAEPAPPSGYVHATASSKPVSAAPPPPQPKPASPSKPKPPPPQPTAPVAPPPLPVSAGGMELAGTLEQVVGQLDILAQTVALLEQRLSLSEDRNARLEMILKQALGQAPPANVDYA